MSKDEQHRILGQLVDERRDLRRTLTCLKNQIQWADGGMSRAKKAIHEALEQGVVVGEESGIAYPNAEELMSLLEQYREAKNRLDEIEADLDAC